MAAVGRPPRLAQAGLCWTVSATLVSCCDRPVSVGWTHRPVRYLNGPLPSTQQWRRGSQLLGACHIDVDSKCVLCIEDFGLHP